MRWWFESYVGQRYNRDDGDDEGDGEDGEDGDDGDSEVSAHGHLTCVTASVNNTAYLFWQWPIRMF